MSDWSAAPSPCRVFHSPPPGLPLPAPGSSLLPSGPVPGFHLPPSAGTRSPPAALHGSLSEPRPHGSAGFAELGGGLSQDPVSLPRGVEPGFRLRLGGVPPGGAQLRPEGEPGSAPRRECSHEFPLPSVPPEP